MQTKMDSGHQKKKSVKNKGFIGFLMVAMLIVATVVLFALSPMFKVRGIGVHGNNHYSILEIVNASGIETNQNGFTYVGGSLAEIIGLRCGDAEGKIIQVLPYVDEAIVKYIVPDMVAIEITEREPALVVPYMTAYLLVDEKGNVLDTVKNTGHGVPVARGMEVDSYKLGQPLVMENKDSFDGIIGLIEAIRQSDISSEREILDSIECFEASGDEIHFRVDSRITVKVPTRGDYDYIVRFFREIYDKNITTDEKGVLDFSAGPNPVYTPERQEH